MRNRREVQPGEQSASNFEITVADSGLGIPKDQLDELFQMQSKRSTKGTANKTGTGLGLLLCKDFINRNNGNLRAESKVGKGSRFIFTLPAKS